MDISGKNNCGFMSREEWIKEAKKKGYNENEINKLLEKHDNDEEKYNIVIPYEIIDLDIDN